jgi:hypothetical protein
LVTADEVLDSSVQISLRADLDVWMLTLPSIVDMKWLGIRSASPGQSFQLCAARDSNPNPRIERLAPRGIHRA